MKPIYQQWINDNKSTFDEFAPCKSASQCMVDQFPELTLNKGHYYCVVWGEREHWWTTDDEGQIVDPTAYQFPSKGNGVYTALIDGSPEPTGKCPNCGKYIYDGEHVHSECVDEFVASL